MNVNKTLLGLFLFVPIAQANIIPMNNTNTATQQKLSDQNLIYQQERQKALQSTLDVEAPTVRLMPDEELQSTMLNFPQETSCFPIHHLAIETDKGERVSLWLRLFLQNAKIEGRCLGSAGINTLMTAIQNQLISQGYVTSRVVAPEQDITSGTLQLVVIDGLISRLLYSQESVKYAQLWNTMPTSAGKSLNLRDIEQGLENLRRLPTVTATMELVPGDNLGESNVVITRQQSRFWRLAASVDDSGTSTTGRYQGGMTLFLDNPLSLSDSFYVSLGHDLSDSKAYFSHNYLFHYSLPFGYWLFSTSVSSNQYEQTVAGALVDYKYSGRSRNLNFQLSRVLYRDEKQKTTFNYGVTLKESRNYIDKSELDIQHRKTTQWSAGIQHRRYFGNTVFDIGLMYQRGVRWGGAQIAPEEYQQYGTALAQLARYNLSIFAPFAYNTQHFAYKADIQGQYSLKGKLTPPDRFSIGGRWSVRGFNGELSLSADNGWYWRNELIWYVPSVIDELYLGFDYGQVSGEAAEFLIGKRLGGLALGMRGSVLNIHYDLFAASPIHKPEGFITDDVTLGFNLNWNY